MLARAPVAVPACPDLVVERAVHFVGLSAKDTGKVVRHGCEVWGWELWRKEPGDLTRRKLSRKAKPRVRLVVA